MDCNKDEATRAKGIAETKMSNNDYQGARVYASKAQRLYPELDNITQLLSICDVHCAAEKKIIGSEKDWYGIIQVDREADNSTIKKQYRRMALLLHPDKNRLPGAEAAFKLISEANAIFSDSTKKSIYDAKIRGSAPTKLQTLMKPQPPPHMNRNSNIKQRPGFQHNVTNGFGNLNQYKADLFSTFCPGCKQKFQVKRKHVNKNIACKKCSRPFLASETSGPDVPNFTQPAAQVPTKPGSGQVGVQNVKGRSAPYAGSRENISTKPTQPGPGTKISNCKGINVGKSFGQPNAQVPSRPDSSKVAVEQSQGFGKVGVQNFQGHSASNAGAAIGINREGIQVASALSGNEGTKANGTSTEHKDGENEPGDLKQNKKRGREKVNEVRESCNHSDDSGFETMTNKVNSGNFSSDVNFEQRSSRQKQNIIYNKTNDDDLLLSERLKKSKVSDSEDSKRGSQKHFPANANFSKLTHKERSTTCFEESLLEKHATFDKEGKVGGKINSETGNGTKSACVESDSDLESDFYLESDSDPELDSADEEAGNTYECPDTEFYDFEKERDGVLFKVGQIWACYDDSDSMPRLYAKVTKATSSPFYLNFKWLEADPKNEAHEASSDGCGTFKVGRIIHNTSARNMFSHKMTNCLPGKKRGSLVIHPKKGEIWALFKRWNPENGKEFKYQVVEVLSDFADCDGVKVCFLDKIKGHVSVFQKASQSESFIIGPDELHTFSHLVPAFKLIGCDGVPPGSFELDPASLPSNPDDLHLPGKAKNESEKMDCPPPKSADCNAPAKSVRTTDVINIESD